MIPREPRLPTKAPIILSARGFGRKFVVENVSSSGAGLTGAKDLRVGERVTLNFKNKSVDAIVRWAANRRVGVAFRERLDDALVHSIAQRPFSDHAKAA
ncbi:PilZ domain protein [Pseudooctadecabacter jejudonensis]|uniref:PilZ domain protein n=2 Tax=Pseudooctadecabacter jejudonensis TaxID=1391910 RepID=A0A1Y5S2Z5_9RHOB|nr:PilZ domain protein [Pseudooctadecabacter jejudonensis]